tara:strand:- start:560 stop:745 length:186 start_codon:yes stop_codon:yes gene_type:complete
MTKIKIHPSVQKAIRSLSYKELIVLLDDVVVNETMHKDDKPVLLKYLKKRIKKLEGENNDT